MVYYVPGGDERETMWVGLFHAVRSPYLPSMLGTWVLTLAYLGQVERECRQALKHNSPWLCANTSLLCVVEGTCGECGMAFEWANQTMCHLANSRPNLGSHVYY